MSGRATLRVTPLYLLLVGREGTSTKALHISIQHREQTDNESQIRQSYTNPKWGFRGDQEPPPPEVGGLGPSLIRRNTSIPSLYLSKATL